jgi:hypothetical protein
LHLGESWKSVKEINQAIPESVSWAKSADRQPRRWGWIREWIRVWWGATEVGSMFVCLMLTFVGAVLISIHGGHCDWKLPANCWYSACLLLLWYFNLTVKIYE